MDTHDALVLARGRQWAADGTARAIREFARLSQRDVGGTVGVSHGAICLWELGQRVPRGEAGLRYARLLVALVEANGKAGMPTPRTAAS